MALAYKSAKMVLGWLGSANETSDVALRIIRTFERAMPPRFGDAGDRELRPENYAPRIEWMRPLQYLWHVPTETIDPTEVPIYKAISGFLSRPYFRRDWILEEMAMARSPAFLVGDQMLSWMQVLRLNRINEEIRDHGSIFFPDEFRSLLGYMPMGTVDAFLKDFERRRELEDTEATNRMGWSSSTLSW